ncbi:alpha/beta fold hydrolase [Marinicrinis lubricantis]|uniref:Alpha/beta fold hydrolase n=1 Tax=Marinicrinis lubricantis TaxID=2086470 RepID=A0ABW1IK89_9BACL
MLNRKTVQIAGRPYPYADEGSGPLLVLIHGFCGSADYWDQVIPLLSSQFRCIAPDLRAHSGSFAPQGPYAINDLAQDIHELLNQLDAPPVVMLGHSLGGYTTLAFAEAYPERLKGFGLIHSTAYPDSEEAKNNRLLAMESIRHDGLEAYVDQLIPKLFAEAHVQPMAEQLDTAIQIGYGTDSEGAVATLEAMRGRPDRNSIIADAKVPVLLAAGDQDRIVPLEKALSVTEEHVRHAVLHNCGHMSMYENPKQISEIIQQFAIHCFSR